MACPRTIPVTSPMIFFVLLCTAVQVSAYDNPDDIRQIPAAILAGIIIAVVVLILCVLCIARRQSVLATARLSAARARARARAANAQTQQPLLPLTHPTQPPMATSPLAANQPPLVKAPGVNPSEPPPPAYDA